MTAEEYYKEAFAGDLELIEMTGSKDSARYSLNSMLKFAELYHFTEVQRIINKSKDASKI